MKAFCTCNRLKLHCSRCNEERNCAFFRNLRTKAITKVIYLCYVLLVNLRKGHPVARVQHGQADEGSIGVGRLTATLTAEVTVLQQNRT